MVGAQHINTVWRGRGPFNGGFWPYLGWQTPDHVGDAHIVGGMVVGRYFACGLSKDQRWRLPRRIPRLRGPDSLAHHRIPLGCDSRYIPIPAMVCCGGPVVVFAVYEVWPKKAQAHRNRRWIRCHSMASNAIGMFPLLARDCSDMASFQTNDLKAQSQLARCLHLRKPLAPSPSAQRRRRDQTLRFPVPYAIGRLSGSSKHSMAHRHPFLPHGVDGAACFYQFAIDAISEGGADSEYEHRLHHRVEDASGF